MTPERVTIPLMLRRANAARLCDMTVAQFQRAINEGDMPQPISIAGEQRWSLAAIEGAISKLSGNGLPEWERRQPGLRNAA